MVVAKRKMVFFSDRSWRNSLPTPDHLAMIVLLSLAARFLDCHVKPGVRTHGSESELTACMAVAPR